MASQTLYGYGPGADVTKQSSQFDKGHYNYAQYMNNSYCMGFLPSKKGEPLN